MAHMTDHEAEVFANDLIALLLKHQENPLGVAPLTSEKDAQDAAKNIVAFRNALVEELTKR